MNSGTKIDTSRSKYSVVKEAFSHFGIDQVPGDPEAPIVWFDGTIPQDFFYTLSSKQRINKIPGMDMICFKSNTFTSLNAMRQQYPKIFTFYPLTFILPAQYSDFQREHIRESNKCKGPVTWIVKPRAGCCGNGIRLIQNTFELGDNKVPCIIQNYISPYLVNGYKFDFRLYLCISTLRPFTAFIYNEGLARFCTKKYSPPTRQTLEDKFAHLTNTSVNVTNSSAPDIDFTRLASDVMAEISASDPRGKHLWEKIKQAATLTMCAIYPAMVTSILNADVEKKTHFKKNKYSTPPKELPDALPLLNRYFHIVGIDIMLNDQMDPIVLELNDRPSMHVTFDIEAKLKPQLIEDALTLITEDGSQPDLSKVSKNWEILLPVKPDDPFGASVHEILSKSRKDMHARLSMFHSARSSSAPRMKVAILPPLKPSCQ